jgi:hypothetical protein
MGYGTGTREVWACITKHDHDYEACVMSALCVRIHDATLQIMERGGTGRGDMTCHMSSGAVYVTGSSSLSLLHTHAPGRAAAGGGAVRVARGGRLGRPRHLARRPGRRRSGPRPRAAPQVTSPPLSTSPVATLSTSPIVALSTSPAGSRSSGHTPI